jgi:hypothetical protein
MSISKSEFTVVLRGPSAAIFWPNEKMTIQGFPSISGPLQITFATRWIKKSETLEVPGHMWIEVVGLGDSLEDVLNIFAQAALFSLPIISFATNAAINAPELELGFESTIGATERDYFQSFVPLETNEVNLSRHINRDATISLMSAHATDPEAERIFRAMSQYQIALDNWRKGQEIFSLAHLWMAVEALTVPFLRAEMAKKAVNSNSELAAAMGVDLGRLDSTIRSEIILQGDKDCYVKAKAASDGFEHGYLSYEKINNHACEVRDRMAQYVRYAIFLAIAPPKETMKTLIEDPFHKPIGSFTIAKYLRGKLLGDSTKLGSGNSLYPFVRWQSTIKSCAAGVDGKVTYSMEENLIMELGEGISFRGTGFEAWRPS